MRKEEGMRGDSHAKGILPPLLFFSSLASIPSFPTPSALVHTIFFFVSVCPPPLSLDPPLLLSFLISTRRKGKSVREIQTRYSYFRDADPHPHRTEPPLPRHMCRCTFFLPSPLGRRRRRGSPLSSFLSFFSRPVAAAAAPVQKQLSPSFFAGRNGRCNIHTHMQAGNSQRRKYRMDLNRTMRKCG